MEDLKLEFRCPYCGYTFRYRRGRIKNPDIIDVGKWLLRAQCPKCGKVLNARGHRQGCEVTSGIIKGIDDHLHKVVEEKCYNMCAFK